MTARTNDLLVRQTRKPMAWAVAGACLLLVLSIAAHLWPTYAEHEATLALERAGGRVIRASPLPEVFRSWLPVAWSNCFDVAEQMDLSGLRLSRRDWINVSRLGRLRILVLKGARVDDKDLRWITGLKKLWWLDLDNTSVTGAGIEQIRSVPHLEVLRASDTLVDDECIVRIARNTRLTQLDIEGTPITDDCLATLARMPTLVTLSVGRTRVTGEGVSQLRECPSLKQLSLNGTSMDDDDLVYLTQLQGLEGLGVRGTRITDYGERILEEALPDALIYR